MQPVARLQRLAVLDHDPALGEDLSAVDLAEARRVLVAPVLALEPGAWTPRSGAAKAGHLGLLVVDGLMTRRIAIGRSVCAELVGPGDLLRPWDDPGAGAAMTHEVSWRVLEDTRLLLLGERFATTAARWPELTGALVGRALNRARGLALSQAIGCMTGLEHRLVTLFWHLADRWGTVGGDGVVVPLRLTHDTIAQLVGARRPSVSSALKLLEREGRIRRLGRDAWLLAPEPGAVMTGGPGGHCPPADMRRQARPALEAV